KRVSTNGWQNCSSKWRKSGPPSHPVHRYSRHRVFVFAGIGKAVFFVKVNGAKVVLIDEEVDPSRRKTFGFFQKYQCDVGTPMLWRNDDLVEIHCFWIDRDKTDERLAALRKHDMRDRHQLLAPALTPPCDARGKIDMRIVLCPGAPP